MENTQLYQFTLNFLLNQTPVNQGGSAGVRLTLAGQQGVQGLGPTLQLFSVNLALLAVAHLTPLAHEEQTRPPLLSTVGPEPEKW